MSSAKEIVALAQSLSSQSLSSISTPSQETNALLAESATALGLVTTKDMLGNTSSSESLYLSELSRNLAEWLMDDARGVLRKAGGIISLVDLWAMFNRARGGVELVSPTDFVAAARLWSTLKLPIRLRQFRSGLLVVQSSDRSDEKTTKSIVEWLQELRMMGAGASGLGDEGVRGCGIGKEPAWDFSLFGRGVTAQEVAERFGWSIGVAAEELEMAEERGALCREEGIEGLRFWQNWIISSVC